MTRHVTHVIFPSKLTGLATWRLKLVFPPVLHINTLPSRYTSVHNTSHIVDMIISCVDAHVYAIFGVWYRCCGLSVRLSVSLTYPVELWSTLTIGSPYLRCSTARKWKNLYENGYYYWRMWRLVSWWPSGHALLRQSRSLHRDMTYYTELTFTRHTKYWLGIKFNVYFLFGADISAAVTDRREILQNGRAETRTCLLAFWWRYIKGSPNAGSRNWLGWTIYGLSDTYFFSQLTANISKTV